MGLWSMVKAFVSTGKGRAPKVAPAEAKRRIDSGAFVLDVRERGEFRRGHIPGAVNIPLGEVAARVAEIPKDRPVVVHCHLGSRSARACGVLEGAGFTDLVDLEGGIAAWQRKDLPVER